MPRKSFKDLHFKTSEQIKLNTKKLKCKICGKKVKGKSTLSRHISHAHNKIDPVKREKMVIDAYFGQAKVDDAIKKYKNGIYNLSTIPIDISRYISLAEIEPYDAEETKKTKVKEISKTEKEKLEIPKNYSIVKVVDSSDESAPVQFVKDAVYDFADDKLKLKLTQTLEDALPYVVLKAFVTKLKLKDSIIYLIVGKEDKIVKAESSTPLTDSEVGEDRVQCTVTYSGNFSSKEEKDEE